MKKLLLVTFCLLFVTACSSQHNESKFDIYAHTEEQQWSYFDSDERYDYIADDIESNMVIMRKALEGNEFDGEMGVLGNFSAFTEEESATFEQYIQYFAFDMTSEEIANVDSFFSNVINRTGEKLSKHEADFTFATLRLRNLLIEELAVSGIMTWDKEELYPTDAYLILLEELLDLYLVEKEDAEEHLALLEAAAIRESSFTYLDGRTEDLSRDTFVQMFDFSENFKKNIHIFENIVDKYTT